MEDINSEIFNNFIKDIKNSSQNHKKTKNRNVNNKIKDEKKIISDSHKKEKEENKENEKENEKKIQIKLIKIENDLLMQKLKQKEEIIKDYKKKCKEQKNRILELQNKIKDLTNKENIRPKEDNINDFLNKEIMDEFKNIPKNKFNEDKNKLRLDNIETKIFDIDNAEYYQCGICMDSFQDEEKVKRLSCGHIFHNDCLNQWIQSNNNCYFCGLNI